MPRHFTTARLPAHIAPYNRSVRVIIAVTDLLTRSRLEGAARAAGYDVEVAAAVPGPAEPPADLLVVDLDQPGAIEALEAWRAAHPQARACGFGFHVGEELLRRAEGLGVRVLPHGATTRAAQFFA